jgi:hypothetical protein
MGVGMGTGTYNLPVTLGSSLSESLASFASSRHCGKNGRELADEQRRWRVAGREVR